MDCKGVDGEVGVALGWLEGDASSGGRLAHWRRGRHGWVDGLPVDPLFSFQGDGCMSE